MTDKIKLTGDERRAQLLDWLKSSSPLTGNELAQRASVSRQVIVQDMTLLKARNEPILATSQGYVYMESDSRQGPALLERVIAVQHTPEQSEEELLLIVDHGVGVKDVIVEHPVYGQISAQIRVHTRKEVYEFISNIRSSKATFISELTQGVHLHTLTSPSEERLDEVCEALREIGFLVTD
ncbi:transcription repressor NadR [Paenibacillus sp. JX-17]|uniref:Transcription repressor NadR n=1 Tax=Paenibacillus lacisoli TaxID=3064525 RepID=A0ABT9C8J1_9BACL|nr:transcription repressor NadR [Paenibacillus sp. JX-17]MDO7905564.1 transcription repressor NadR [Paenibacillus sp. JX-17]